MTGTTELTRRLAEFACDTRELPAAVRAAARVALQDTVGVALAGCTEPAVMAAIDFARESSGGRGVLLWGHDVRCAPADAALVNAIAIHALDFDDTLATLRGHPSAPVLAAALATAEHTRCSGRELLVAYALGIDVSGKLGILLGNGHYLKGWHNTATLGVFSATAAVARLHGATPAVLQAAWGIAAAQSAGLLRNFGTMSKPFQAGHAARSAILAVGLATRGFTADDHIFDGPDGFPSTYAADGVTPAAVAALLGKQWDLVMPGINYKRWPCCYCSHRALGGLLGLMARHELHAADIEQVSIGFPPGSDEPLVYDDPRTGLQGKFSIQYPVAALLLDGSLVPDSFTDAAVSRPAVRALMQKVRRYRVADSKVYSGTVGYTDIEITTRRGRFAERIDKGPGSASWPMTPAEHDEKFLGCAGRVLDAGAARKLMAAIQDIELQDDAATLAALMTVRRGGTA